MQKAGGGTSARTWSLERGTQSGTRLGTRGSHARGVVYIRIRETGERSWPLPTGDARAGRKGPRPRMQLNKAPSEPATKGHTTWAGQRAGLRGGTHATLVRVSRPFCSCHAARTQLFKEPLFQPTSVPTRAKVKTAGPLPRGLSRDLCGSAGLAKKHMTSARYWSSQMGTPSMTRGPSVRG